MQLKSCRTAGHWGLLTGAVALAATGCFLHLAVVTTFFDDLSDFIDAHFETDATLGHCSENPFSEALIVECDYAVGGLPFTSTSSLLSEFGLLGVLIDPLVLQVPDTVSNFSGTWDAGDGPAPLEVTRTDSFAAQTGVDVVAEAGQTFLIFELPNAAAQALLSESESADLALTGAFRIDATEAAPFDVKPMLTARANVAENVYYLPQVPCVTDFAQVPAVTIPVPATDLDLAPLIGAAFAGVTGCQNASYSFFGDRLDDFHRVLWKAKSNTKPAGTLTATDALGSRTVDVKKTSLVGLAASYNQQDPDALLSPDQLVAYKAKTSRGQPKEAGPKGVRVANRAGSQTLDLKKIDQVLLPAALDLAAPIAPLGMPGVSPFVCWKAKLSKGTERPPKGQQHLLADPLGGALYTLKKPTRLCLPADVDGAAPGAEADGVALLCFKAKAQKPRPPGRDGVHTNDALGPQILRAKKPGEICFPSTFLL